MISPPTDLGANIVCAPAGGSSTTGAPVLIVAGAATDNVKRTGLTIDRMTFGLPDSGTLSICGLFTLAQAATATATTEIQESDDNSSWTTAVVLLAATVVATGGTGGTNEAFTKEVDVVLRGRKRYVRFNTTIDLSAASADTGHYDQTFVMGGQADLPV